MQRFGGNLVGFRNSAERLCNSWALSLNKRVRVSACKQHMPDTHVFVPTYHKVFLLDYWKLNKLAAEHLSQTSCLKCNWEVRHTFSLICFQTYAHCLLRFLTNYLSLIKRIRLFSFLDSSNWPRKDLHLVDTNAQVSGMCLLHADTSADLSERKRHEM